MFNLRQLWQAWFFLFLGVHIAGHLEEGQYRFVNKVQDS